MSEALSKKDLNEKLDSTIAKLADNARSQQDAQKALHFSQSALNLAHTKNIINVPPETKNSDPLKP